MSYEYEFKEHSISPVWVPDPKGAPQKSVGFIDGLDALAESWERRLEKIELRDPSEYAEGCINAIRQCIKELRAHSESASNNGIGE